MPSVVLDDVLVKNGSDQWVNFRSGGTSSGLALGRVVYTQSEIDAWTTGSAYTALAADGWGSTSRSVTDHGTATMDTITQSLIRDDGGYAKVQAVLWAVDGSPTRLAKVIEVLDGVKDITAHATTSSQGQRNLECSWGFTNMVQAAAIIGRANYDNAQFDSFLENIAYPMMDWSTGMNWLASFIDCRFAIASYLEDATLWADAMDYLDYRIKQCIFHDTYDSGVVEPIRNSSGWPNIWPDVVNGSINDGLTLTHWNDQVSTGSPYELTAPDGTSAERLRDMSHESQGMSSLIHACRTIEACGGTVPTHVHERVKAFVNYHASRVLYHAETGLYLAPEGDQEPGGGAMYDGWFGAKKYLGADASSDVDDLLVHSEVTSRDIGGANQTVAERLADA